MQEWIKIDSDIKAEKSALIPFQPYKTVGKKALYPMLVVFNVGSLVWERDIECKVTRGY